jgi:hypothetical protein
MHIYLHFHIFFTTKIGIIPPNIRLSQNHTAAFTLDTLQEIKLLNAPANFMMTLNLPTLPMLDVLALRPPILEAPALRPYMLKVSALRPLMLELPALRLLTLKVLALRSATILEVPALRLPTLGAPVPRPPMLEAFPTSLDLPSIQTTLDSPATTMLDVPAPTSLDVPALPPTTLDTPAYPVYFICGNSLLLWPPGFVASGPSNPHDPGPSSAPLRAHGSIAFGPSNSHDPGPSAAVADHIISAFTHLAFPAIIDYALIDFLLTPPRSPSIVQIAP